MTPLASGTRQKAVTSWFFRVDDVQPTHPGVVIVLSGRLGHAAARSLTSLLDQSVRDHPSRIVLDLSGVDYISSPGLEALDEVANRLRKVGGALLLRGLRPPVRLALELAQVSHPLLDET